MISFSGDGRIITPPVQVVGAYNSEGSTWLWGWDHPSVSEPLGHDARLARDVGAKYELETLTTRKVACSENDAWQFTALACHLAGAIT